MAIKKEAYESTNDAVAQDKCVMLCVERHGIGTWRTLNKSQFEVDADKDKVGAHKKILKESEYLAKIDTLMRVEIEQFLNRKALPAPFKRGWFLLPIEMIEEVDKAFAEFQMRLEDYKEQFIKELPRCKDLDKKTLRGTYRERDYPTAQEIRAQYEIVVRYVDFKVPEKLRKVSSKIFARQQDSLSQLWKEAEVEATAFLAGSAEDMVKRLVERLAEYGVKKGARFTDTMVTNITAFVQDFAKRNIAGDAKLAAVVAKMKAAIGNVSADNLRANDGLRKTVLTKFETIKTEIEKLPIRAISFDD